MRSGADLQDLLDYVPAGERSKVVNALVEAQMSPWVRGSITALQSSGSNN
jgi:hypothetical protein